MQAASFLQGYILLSLWQGLVEGKQQWQSKQLPWWDGQRTAVEEHEYRQLSVDTCQLVGGDWLEVGFPAKEEAKIPRIRADKEGKTVGKGEGKPRAAPTTQQLPARPHARQANTKPNLFSLISWAIPKQHAPDSS